MTPTEILVAELRNRQWIESRLEELGKRFKGKYIAVFNECLIASAFSIAEVQREIRNSTLFPFIPQDEVTIAFLSDEPNGMLLHLCPS